MQHTIGAKYRFLDYRNQLHYTTAPSRSGPGSIPGRDKFPGCFFFRGFSSPVRQMSGNFRPPRSPNITCHHYHPYSFITGTNDLRCWRALKPQIYILLLFISILVLFSLLIIDPGYINFLVHSNLYRLFHI